MGNVRRGQIAPQPEPRRARGLRGGRVVFAALGGGVAALGTLWLTTPKAVVDQALARPETPARPAQPSTPPAPPSKPQAQPSKPPAQPFPEPVAVASLDRGAAVVEPQLVEPPAEGELGDEPLPAEDDPHVLAPDAFLGALAKQTIVRSRPDPQARIVGYARTGALLRRGALPAATKSCKGGWYRVEPTGYVCVGPAATLDTTHPILQVASMGPDRTLPMPYLYGRSRNPTPTLYTRIPSKDEQRRAEQDLAQHLPKNFGSLWPDEASLAPPELLRDGSRVPRPFGYPELAHDFTTGRALTNSAFSFIDLFEAEGRRYGLTADLDVVPLDRVTPIEPSDFAGLHLTEKASLPVAFVHKHGESLYAGDPEAGTLRPERRIDYREAFSLTGESVEYRGATYLATTSGHYLRQHDRLVHVERRDKMPKWARDERTWIEVSIRKQALVAYRGTTPVFTTLVSTGKDGLGDPEETHSTVQGVFLIHTKHVTATMSGSEADDEFDLRDVPYVQYFQGGYAFHAAYWHDSFGTPRSHGCVNLSPSDARTLFGWSEPPVPQAWHSALSREGTLVYIHP